jgi:hypothetical protein
MPMNGVRWVQALGALTLVMALAAGRIPAFRPHARRIAIVMAVLYVAAAIGVVAWRFVAGPGAFME